jgi:hypothetical protein
VRGAYENGQGRRGQGEGRKDRRVRSEKKTTKSSEEIASGDNKNEPSASPFFVQAVHTIDSHPLPDL